MMKATPGLLGFTGLALLASAAPAVADDGGMLGISVKDLAMYSTRAEKPAKIANPSYRIDLNGGDATKLLQVLPPSISVLTGMYPKLQKTYAANFRSLGITGAPGQPTVQIECAGGALQFNGGAPTFQPYREGAQCSILVLPEANGDDNIEYSFNPAKDVCAK